jgi:transposase, IS5 family
MQLGFFDINKRYEQLNKLNDPLLVLSKWINFEIFRKTIEEGLEKERKDNSGRKAFDKIMLFKGLVLKRLYDLSNETLEFQITDRSSFRRFLGLKEENKEIKEGKIPESFTENIHKFAQKDTNARWTKKGNETYYGYKDHINVDVEHKLIRGYEVTSAEVHDSQPLEKLLDDKNDTAKLWADSAYRSETILALLFSKLIEANINERAYKNKPLTDEQKSENRVRSKTRARVEHVFGFITNSLKADIIRTIGVVRAKSQIAMINLTYNLCRFCQLEKLKSLSMA